MIHAPMPYAEYDGLPGLRWSRLKHLLRSPKEYLFQEKLSLNGSGDSHESQEKDALTIGRAVHCRLLEPERWGKDFAIWTGKIRSGNVWSDFRAAHAGQTILRTKDVDRVDAVTKAVRAHNIAGRLLETGVREMVVTWEEKMAQLIKCKARIDLVNGKQVDIKTSHDPEERAFKRAVISMAYPEQMAFYRRGLRANRQHLEPGAVLIACESAPPYDVVVYQLDEETLDAADVNVGQLLNRWLTCLRNETWPGIAEDRIVPIEMPDWWKEEREEPLSLGGERFNP